ncbi:uncharacterized protein TrAFT101_001750 [Trichoderma asperellum]|uniref:Uncharacterized protein n=1 Tax=Trichoderma asperellum (strain ATCC 204424 / CBS 433.97 / NBRC 101777) TaxID=1042311 RepID=A0A2T3ZEI5_TRIA4|nr:hypothetical protein M441DRAFT_25264 [Trichoderma asperellum CBS 433.97]PTB43199.1 hypothetical protein M441DRAFT_25264 [Trichoderma asperellum CBS 433.97]UKZ85907.1 hypothetical protein TrAFT101_001750 [Trichoderma asperellum]
MSRPSELSVPKSGASRFSKALPTVPGLDDYYTDDDGESNIGGDNNNNNSNNNSNNNNNTSHNRKNSEYSLPARTSSLASPQAKTLPLPPLPPPVPPPTKTLPPTPQSQTNPSSKVNSYSSTASANIVAAPSIAPSTPSSALSAGMLSLQSPPLSAGSKMSIPRKPVANLKLPAPSPQYLAQPSPTFSLSSLLSAYMGDGDESRSPSLYETTTSISEIDRQEVAAPGSEKSVAAAEASSVIAAATAAFPAVPSKPKATTSGSGSLPAAPNAGTGTGIGAGAAAATQYQRRAERDLPPPPPQDEPAAELSTPSSPRPEIWKRRPHMTQASRELPGLTLDYSHGSTADTQLPADQDNSQALPETVKAAVQRAPPFAGGLPGRNIRPSLGAKDQPPPAAQIMGSETSKLKQIKDRLGSQRSESISSTSSAKAGFPGAPAVQRPPTPEYRKEDVKQPTVEPFISPVSPASSPEAPRGASPDFAKDLPPKPPKDSQLAAANTQPLSRKAIPISPSQDLTAAKNSSRPPSDTKSTSTSSQATVSPVLRKGDTVPVPAAAPVPAPVTASPPNDWGSARPRVSGGTSTAAVQPQPAVIQTDVSQIANSKQSTPQPTSDPRLLKSETQGLLYRGRDGTLYPEMKVEGEPHPKAAYFPTQTFSSLPKDGIIKARPLTNTHFDCFQQHRTMNRRSNKNCPLTCQACDRADLEDRWACSFCHVRICDPCYRKLGSYQWNLRRLVDNLANAGPLSQSRPDTAPGLQATL